MEMDRFSPMCLPQQYKSENHLYSSCVIPRLITPHSDIPDQITGQMVTVWDLDRTLAVFQTASFKFRGKVKHRLRSRIQSDVLLLRSEMNDVMLIPVSRHAPGDLFGSIRKCLSQAFSYDQQLLPDGRIKLQNVLIDRLRLFAAVMRLILSGELSPANRFEISLRLSCR